jgi:hypothetical protein
MIFRNVSRREVPAVIEESTPVYPIIAIAIINCCQKNGGERADETGAVDPRHRTEAFGVAGIIVHAGPDDASRFSANPINRFARYNQADEESP